MRTLLLILTLLISTGASHATDRTFKGDYFPYGAFDGLAHSEVEVPGGTLVVGFAPGELDLSRAMVLRWIEHSARTVSAYYGRFPVGRTRVLVVPIGGDGVQGGTAWGWNGAALRVMIGKRSDERDLYRDWRLVHEMVHFALPPVAARHQWLSEGLAVYVESVARTRAGDLSPETMWGLFARDMPQGLHGPGERGLDMTRSWGNTYWGGAIFCLLADIQIRRQTDNRLGLEHAMRGVLRAGGNHEQEQWPIARILKTADEAVGVEVLWPLYRKMRATRNTTGLDPLWQSLGVDFQDGRVVLNDDAELAAIRRGITAPEADTPTVN